MCTFLKKKIGCSYKLRKKGWRWGGKVVDLQELISVNFEWFFSSERASLGIALNLVCILRPNNAYRAGLILICSVGGVALPRFAMVRTLICEWVSNCGSAENMTFYSFYIKVFLYQGLECWSWIFYSIGLVLRQLWLSHSSLPSLEKLRGKQPKQNSIWNY